MSFDAIVWQQWTLIVMFLLGELLDIGSIGVVPSTKPADVVLRSFGRIVMGVLVLAI